MELFIFFGLMVFCIISLLVILGSSGFLFIWSSGPANTITVKVDGYKIHSLSQTFFSLFYFFLSDHHIARSSHQQHATLSYSKSLPDFISFLGEGGRLNFLSKLFGASLKVCTKKPSKSLRQQEIRFPPITLFEDIFFKLSTLIWRNLGPIS